MFKQIRELRSDVQALTEAISLGTDVLANALQGRGADEVLRERVASLEAQIVLREAEAAALIVEAKAVFKSARAAEERERGYAKKAEAALLAAGDEEGADPIPGWYLDQLQPGDGDRSEENGLQPVPSRMETSADIVARLRAQKFGGVI